jgi:hypothetical protein
MEVDMFDDDGTNGWGAIVVGLFVVMVLVVGMMTLVGAPALSVAVVEKLAASQPEPTPVMIDRDSSSKVEMTVGELQAIIDTLLRHDREMNRKSLETVRDVAVAGDSAQIAQAGILMTPQCIGSIALLLVAVGVIIMAGKRSD